LSDGVGVALEKSALPAPIEWSAHVLPCVTGEKAQQLQGIYPLDEKGDLVLVGRSGGCLGHEDYQVFDLSSGTPAMLDAIFTGAPGFNLGTHSPHGSGAGFAATGKQLVVYDPDDGFSMVAIPCDGNCTATGVWAASPTDVWIVTGGPGTVGRILRYRDGAFTVEYEGGVLQDVWGFGANANHVFAVGADGILRRGHGGTWELVLDGSDLPGACRPFWSIHGSHPEHVWAAGSAGCLFHGDGETWTAVPTPDVMVGVIAVWSFNPQQVLIAGQGGVDLSAGRVALWGSVDGGASWTQVSDAAFTGLPTGGDAAFFNVAATKGGTRIYAPAINGTLLFGAVNWHGFSGQAAARTRQAAILGAGILPGE
jgi:hypothetical protein